MYIFRMNALTFIQMHNKFLYNQVLCIIYCNKPVNLVHLFILILNYIIFNYTSSLSVFYL